MPFLLRRTRPPAPRRRSHPPTTPADRSSLPAYLFLRRSFAQRFVRSLRHPPCSRPCCWAPSRTRARRLPSRRRAGRFEIRPLRRLHRHHPWRRLQAYPSIQSSRRLTRSCPSARALMRIRASAGRRPARTPPRAFTVTQTGYGCHSVRSPGHRHPPTRRRGPAVRQPRERKDPRHCHVAERLAVCNHLPAQHSRGRLWHHVQREYPQHREGRRGRPVREHQSAVLYRDRRFGRPQAHPHRVRKHR